MAQRRQTIALCAVLGSEDASHDAWLDSVRGLIDSWTVIDTGSGDAATRLERVLGSLPGALYQRPPRDSGTSKTELVELAAGSADYLLLVDPPMTVVRRGKIPRLSADAYLLRELGQLESTAPRLIRGDRSWWFDGVIYPRLRGEPPVTEVELPALAVRRQRTSLRHQRAQLTHDASLLEQALSTNPEDSASVFWLAQTLRDLGRTDPAIALYRRRVGLGGDEEEVFYAAFQAGVLAARTEAMEGIRWLLGAIELRPTRAEPFYELARLCRSYGWHAAAYAFARWGIALPYPDDRLLVHRDVYRWGLASELVRAAEQLGLIDEAIDVAERLSGQRELPPRRAAAFAADASRLRMARAPRAARGAPSKLLNELVPSLELGELVLAAEISGRATSAAIAADGDEQRLLLQTAACNSDDTGQGAHNQTFLIRINVGLELVAAQALGWSATTEHLRQLIVRPLLLGLGGRWHAAARASDDLHGESWVLLELDDHIVKAATPIVRGTAHSAVTDWIPVGVEGEPYFVGGFAPVVVSKSGRVHESPGPGWAATLRPAAPGLRVAGGWLFVVAEIAPRALATHRFVLLDDDFQAVARSVAFSFTGEVGERCAGLARRGRDLVLSFTTGWGLAVLALLDEEEVCGLLAPQ